MSTLQEKINALPIEERAWLLGTKSENPLGCAFAKKRVVHPGAGGKRMVMDKEEQTRIWADLMAQTPNPADERAVYIHIPFCDKNAATADFFRTSRGKKRRITTSMCSSMSWMRQRIRPTCRAHPFRRCSSAAVRRQR